MKSVEACLQVPGFAVPKAGRIKLLAGVPAFGALPEEALEELAACMREEYFPQDKTVISEGEKGSCLYLIAEGRAEVTTTTASGPAILATLAAGEMFGEMALLSPINERQATVTALTSLFTLVFDSTAFSSFMTSNPDIKEAFDASVDVMLTAKFIKRASPFSRVDAQHARFLAARLIHRSVPSGAVIVRQGESGDKCYLIRSGSVEVVAETDGKMGKCLATLGAGSVFGEAALLTEVPRNATVRALEPTELLLLKRSDLLQVLISNPVIMSAMVELLRLRERPQKPEGIVVQHRTTPDGDTITILKDPGRSRYYRLSPEGWFLWQRLDGRHTLRDLTLDYLSCYKLFAPYVIAGVVEGLARAGFLESRSLRADVEAAATPLSRTRRMQLLMCRIMEWKMIAKNTDTMISNQYRHVVYLMYKRWSQITVGVISFSGLVVFVERMHAGEIVMFGDFSAPYILFIVTAYILSVLVHEAAHAFTVKAFGREVPHVGIGWYWFTPVAFVDTSDMWLAGRWQRIAVSLAGPYSNIALAGLAALLSVLTSEYDLIVKLLQFSLISYTIAILNLNPLLEYDGYHALTDLLSRPNLRQDTLCWLRNNMLKPPGFQNLREHLIEFLFCVTALVYVILAAGICLYLSRLFHSE